MINKERLGTGSYGQVYLAVDRQDPNLKVAIKVINKQKLSKEDVAAIMDEVQILLTVDHPNIVAYHETYDDHNYIYLVMEHLPGGELFDSPQIFKKEGTSYTEGDAAGVISKLLEALHHCHSLGIVHRDMKPENIMFGADGEVRIVDFGLAKESVAKMSTFAGTPYFMAPEVLNHNYGQKCDVWSMGCVLYMLVAGKLPFSGRSKDEVFNRIKNSLYEEPMHVSAHCRDLLKKMLTVDPLKRLTAAEARQHPWF